MKKIILALAIATLTNYINEPVQAQFPQLSEAVRRNGTQPSESLINLLTGWQGLQGQNVTVSNVNVHCLNLTCIAIAKGQYVALKTEQIDREVLRRMLACSPFGCAATVSGTVERLLGNIPILTYPIIVFTEGNQPIAQNPIPKAISVQPSEITPSKSTSKKIADGVYITDIAMADLPELEVKGNQYRIVNTDGGGPQPWKPLSELRYVREGVVSNTGLRYVREGVVSAYKNITIYWCSEKAPGYTKFDGRRRTGTCNSNGWEWRYG